jgi:hypothetical protein
MAKLSCIVEGVKMKTLVVSVRDIRGGFWGQPYFVMSSGSATRSFMDQCNKKTDPDNILAQHPEDFELWHLGYYDDEHGDFEVFATVDRVRLIAGSDSVAK